MLKLTTSLLCLFSLVIATLPSTAVAQTKEAPVAKQTALKNSTEKSPDLKIAVDQKSKEFSVQSSTFDPVKTERENANHQAQQKKGMSKTKKALLWTAVAVGLAAVIFVAIKYAKKCIRYSDDCDYNPNTGNYDCPCEEYEQRNQ